MIIKKKLRDLSEKEAMDLGVKICRSHYKTCNTCMLYNVLCGTTSERYWAKHKELYSDKFLDQEVEVEIPDILRPEEKNYLVDICRRIIFQDLFIRRGLVSLFIETSDLIIFEIQLCILKLKFDGMNIMQKYSIKELLS